MYTRRRKIEALSYHDLFKQLSGNPASIAFFANAVSNKFKSFHTIGMLYERSILKEEAVDSIMSEN